MDKRDFAQLMIDWADAQSTADELRAQIEAEVLALGKTQVVGNVRATYSQGRKVYDYAGAIAEHEAAGLFNSDMLDPYRTYSIDFRAACQGLGIKDVPFTQGEPSVSVKLGS